MLKLCVNKAHTDAHTQRQPQHSQSKYGPITAAAAVQA